MRTLHVLLYYMIENLSHFTSEIASELIRYIVKCVFHIIIEKIKVMKHTSIVCCFVLIHFSVLSSLKIYVHTFGT